MINLNGKHFAKNDDEMIDSLFTGGNTCVGFYKVNKTSITLLDMQKEKIGMINKNGCLISATKQEDNKYWYTFATIDCIGEYENFKTEYNEPRIILGQLTDINTSTTLM